MDLWTITLRSSAAPKLVKSGATRQQSGVDGIEQLYALITGVSSGIGRATAILLANKGWSVFGTAINEADEVVVSQLHERITAVRMDVTNGESIAAAVEQVTEATNGKGLAALVNNAGVAIRGPLEHIPLPLLRRQLEINLVGPLAVTQAFLPLLKAGKSPGRIVMIGSSCGTVVCPLWGPYAMSKFGLEALSDTLRLELAEQGIKVIIIRPGPVKTPLWSLSNNDAAAIMADMTPEATSQYGSLFRRVQALVLNAERTGADVSDVANVVLKALTSSLPMARYAVPFSCTVQILLRMIMPDALWDWVLMNFSLPADPAKSTC